MSLKTLAKATGSGFKTLAKATADNTKSALNPKKGDRKVRLTLILSIPFLLLCAFLMFQFRENIVDMLKVMKEFIVYVLGIFTGGNSLENLSDSINKKIGDGGDSDVGGGPPPPPPAGDDKPFAP
jgi:hypothetical protein